MSEFNWDVERSLTMQEVIEIKQKINELKDKIKSYQGKIVDNLITVLKLDDELSMLLEQVYVYHSHLNDIDLSSSDNQGKMLEITSFYHQIINELSFLMPEILKADKDILIKIASDNPLYEKQINELAEQKPYVLSDKEEAVIAKASDALNNAYDIYSTLTNAELKFDQVVDKDGNELEMSEAKWSQYSHSYDQVLRASAFKSLMHGYESLKQTITMIYISYLKTQKFNTDVRGYKNPRFKALYQNQIDEPIYDNLIDAVNQNIEFNHEYLKLKKEVMQLDEMHLYDVYAPMFDDVKTKYEYQEACELVVDSLAVLGQEYTNQIKTALTNQSIDVYPSEGKRSGAYSGGSYLSKPYVLLNYTDTLNDVFTLTHELGHSMHSLNTNITQKYNNSHYKIFVAEIASTVNELLLFNHMVNSDIDKKTKMYLINHNLEQFRTTVYRQTMFAEFEAQSIKMFYDGEPINQEILSNLYLELNQKYMGDSVVIDDEIKYEWLRIPHFYYNFYVYQYATSFCIAQKIVSEILSGNEMMKVNYLNFLKAGDSIKPIELIKTMGIDITKVDPLNDALKAYEQQINELKSLLKE